MKILNEYYDLRIVSKHSYGSDTIEEIVKRAEKLELKTICIADRINDVSKFDEIKKEIAETKEKTNAKVEILQGVELKAKNADELRRFVDKFRDIADLIIVTGGELDVNRAACENPKVNILSCPEKQRKDSGLDHVMAKLASENKVAIELCFRDYLQAYKKIRTYVLTHMRRNVLLCQQFETPLIVTSGAENLWDMRSGRELATLATNCGLERERAVRTVTETPRWVIDRVKQIKSPEYVAAGVEIVKEEKEIEPIEDEFSEE